MYGHTWSVWVWIHQQETAIRDLTSCVLVSWNVVNIEIEFREQTQEGSMKALPAVATPAYTASVSMEIFQKGDQVAPAEIVCFLSDPSAPNGPAALAPNGRRSGTWSLGSPDKQDFVFRMVSRGGPILHVGWSPSANELNGRVDSVQPFF